MYWVRSFLWVLFVGGSTLTVQATAFSPLLSRVGSVMIDTRISTQGKGIISNGSQSIPSSTTTTSLQASPASLMGKSAALLLRGGEVSELATSAYEWCVNLGNPSALVAGAVIATIYENIGSGALDIDDDDSKTIQFGKRLTRVLLLSAFALEVISIFVTTVTGTMLLSKTEHVLDSYNSKIMVTQATTPLSFLRDNFEFEYLTARITFLQGLLNWLGAIALGHIIPSGEKKQSRVMNKFIGSSLVLTITLMLAFYNNHMNFYANYAHMLMRWFHVIAKRFVFQWPPRPSVVLVVPTFINTMYLGYLAFCRPESTDADDKKATE